jgi:diguanylate cyclase (GGDEF)-like protein
MSLRTRIALTFLGLLTAVLIAAVCAVLVADRVNAASAVNEQLEINRRLLNQAAQAVAYDFPFREAVAERDIDTLVSVLENQSLRVGAALAVLTTLDGRVIAAYGSRSAVGSQFPAWAFDSDEGKHTTPFTVMIDDGRIFQVVAVAVRSPLPVARIAIGYELDVNAAQGLAKIRGVSAPLILHAGDQWIDAVTRRPIDAARNREPASAGRPVAPTAAEPRAAIDRFAQSLAGARAPFEKLTRQLLLIAGASLMLFAWAAFWLARNITRPLRELTRSVDRIRAGEYDVRLSLTGRDLTRRDELGVLAEGLELMQTAVMSRDQSIRRLAYEDSLTGLMNRTAFSARLSHALTDARGSPVGIAIINLNRFRRINEHLGYSVGDAVLKAAAARLADVPGVHSSVARLAADHFAAFTRLREPANLQAWSTSLLAALSEPVIVEAQPVDISATLGLAVSQGDAARADDLLRSAELALEQARREKRAAAIYTETQRPGARDQLSLLGELRRAVEHDELRLFFQPKIELATNRVAGAEVLLRWQHPTRGLLGPGDFIPFAEQTGFIRRITRWTLDRAMAQAAQWHRDGTPLPLAVNISADDLADPRLDARVAGLLTRHQLPPSLLTLEITESGFIEDPDQALHTLNALAALGVNISIDDFGTGYSSLSHLARMPADEVKIDRSFVLGLDSDAEYATVVRSAIDMGHSLGLKVVAEGIETPLQSQRLREFGCDIAQGYLFARPMPGDQLKSWLEGKPLVPVIAIPIDFSAEDVSDTVSLATY